MKTSLLLPLLWLSFVCLSYHCVASSSKPCVASIKRSYHPEIDKNDYGSINNLFFRGGSRDKNSIGYILSNIFDNIVASAKKLLPDWLFGTKHSKTKSTKGKTKSPKKNSIISSDPSKRIQKVSDKYTFTLCIYLFVF
jgi:hypothetical protein